MTDQVQIEMLAGGVKPDFFREAVKENEAVCDGCHDGDVDVILVDRTDHRYVLCSDCAEQISPERRIREYIEIDLVPWENPPVAEDEDAEESTEEILARFLKPNGKAWAVQDAEGNILHLVLPEDFKGNSLMDLSEEFAAGVHDAMGMESGAQRTVGATIYMPGDNRFLVSATITVWQVKEISAESAEIFIDEGGEE